MALHPDFPRSPYGPISPDVRWFPAAEELRSTAYEKLLPPLVANIAKCKLIKWFKPGDPIAITPERMRVILVSLLAYRNELIGEQFPEQHILL